MRCRFLVDRDSRRKTLDLIHIGFFELTQELPRIGRKRFDISTLALCVQGVERETRLTRTRNPSNHHKLVAGNLEIDVFKVMFAGTANYDGVVTHSSLAYAIQ